MCRYLALMIVISFAPAIWGHPFHASIAEAEWKPTKNTLEIALRGHGSDLENALRLRTKKRIDLEKTKDIDKLIADYLANVITVKQKNGKKATLTWVGKEITVKATWLYFEISLPAGLEGATIENRLFFELLDDQVNTITFRLRKTGQRNSLSFTADKPKHVFTWKKER